MKKSLITTLLTIILSSTLIAGELKSEHLVAPEYRQSAAKLHIDMNSLADLPAFGARLASSMDQNEKQVERQPSAKITAKGEHDVDLYIFRPDELKAESPVIYFIHGGGFISGNASQGGNILYDLAKRNHAVVISVEYRLASVAPFPAAINDLYQGLSYVYNHAQNLRIDPKRLVIMGESAGGGLAASLALMTRDRGEFKPAGTILIYPMLDYRTGTSQSLYNNPYAGEFVWTPASNRLGWATMHGKQDIAKQQMPYFSAATATDLNDLPPTFIVVGSLDLFVNEDLDYATRLIESGVPTELIVYPGVYHAFNYIHPKSPQTQDYKTRLTSAIQAMFKQSQ
jgi:acetyl esterase/lipase